MLFAYERPLCAISGRPLLGQRLLPVVRNRFPKGRDYLNRLGDGIDHKPFGNLCDLAPRAQSSLKFALAQDEDQSMKRKRFTEEQIIGILKGTKPGFRSPVSAASMVSATPVSINGRSSNSAIGNAHVSASCRADP
jgi:hypothetical protein